jgi:dimethylhistidine N-methyltransferase
MEQAIVKVEHQRAADHDFLSEVWSGLSRQQKCLPSRFFYDARGSELFEQITKLPEYYPTRTEISILTSFATEIGESIAPRAAVVEFGSGSSRKTELLLRALKRPCQYIPIEISAAALFPAARRIENLFPEVEVHPVLGGFHDLHRMKLPRDRSYLGFFPGSTIGNLTREEAVLFFRSARALLGKNAAFLIGADLKKPRHIILPAYNDSQGVTAAFNLNLLARINRELDGTFDLSGFTHEALYNDGRGRVEMHLRSEREHRVLVAGASFSFAAGETIHTENSHKYEISEFHALAGEGSWTPMRTWIDTERLFSLHLFV